MADANRALAALDACPKNERPYSRVACLANPTCRVSTPHPPLFSPTTSTLPIRPNRPICQTAIQELRGLRDESKALQAVHRDCQTQYLGNKSENYARENWVNAILFSILNGAATDR